MKYLALIFFLILFGSTSFAQGFVEAQMSYNIKEDGEKNYSYTWDEESKSAIFILSLKLTNFKKEWHQEGFDLNGAERFYLLFPEPAIDCKLQSAGGEMLGVEGLENNLVTMIFQGDSCRDLDSYFHFLDVTMSFYNVPHLRDKANSTPVLRIVIMDAP